MLAWVWYIVSGCVLLLNWLPYLLLIRNDMPHSVSDNFSMGCYNWEWVYKIVALLNWPFCLLPLDSSLHHQNLNLN